MSLHPCHLRRSNLLSRPFLTPEYTGFVGSVHTVHCDDQNQNTERVKLRKRLHSLPPKSIYSMTFLMYTLRVFRRSLINLITCGREWIHPREPEDHGVSVVGSSRRRSHRVSGLETSLQSFHANLLYFTCGQLRRSSMSIPVPRSVLDTKKKTITEFVIVNPHFFFVVYSFGHKSLKSLRLKRLLVLTLGKPTQEDIVIYDSE